MASRTITKTWNWKISCLNFTNSTSNQNGVSLQALKGGLQLPADDRSMKEGGKNQCTTAYMIGTCTAAVLISVRGKIPLQRMKDGKKLVSWWWWFWHLYVHPHFLKLIIQSQWYGVNTQQPAAFRKWSYGFDGGSRKKCGCCWWSVGKGIEWELADWICKTAPLSSLDNSFPPCVQLADNLR